MIHDHYFVVYLWFILYYCIISWSQSKKNFTNYEIQKETFDEEFETLEGEFKELEHTTKNLSEESRAYLSAIKALMAAKQQGKTIVPLEILTGGRFIKLRISIGKGKKQYDKRQSLKARDDKRCSQAELKAQR